MAAPKHDLYRMTFLVGRDSKLSARMPAALLQFGQRMVLGLTQ